MLTLVVISSSGLSPRSFRFDPVRTPVQRMTRTDSTRIVARERVSARPYQIIAGDNSEVLSLSGSYYTVIAGSGPLEDIWEMRRVGARLWISSTGARQFGRGWIISSIEEKGSEPFMDVFQKYDWSVRLIRDYSHEDRADPVSIITEVAGG